MTKIDKYESALVLLSKGHFENSGRDRWELLEALHRNRTLIYDKVEHLWSSNTYSKHCAEWVFRCFTKMIPEQDNSGYYYSDHTIVDMIEKLGKDDYHEYDDLTFWQRFITIIMEQMSNFKVGENIKGTNMWEPIYEDMIFEAEELEYLFKREES